MSSIVFENVTVHYPIYNSRSMSLRNQLVRIGTGGIIEKEAGNVQIITALKDVSFNIKDGDSVGLIGHNGAGKSTLLRTMAGVYQPVFGQVKTKGKIATLFDMGAGMDPEISGRENVFRMGYLLGMNRAQINIKMKEIEDFTELGKFMDLPMRVYSTGMATRLMFAIATSTEPEILLIDEVFGTGDADFQKKARIRMNSLIESAKIVVFASHTMDLITDYCNRFFKLEHGSLTEVSENSLTD